MANSIKVDISGLTAKVTELKKIKHMAMPIVEKHFHDITPIDTGNARNNTHLENGEYVAALYPYASVLDQGRFLSAKGMRGSLQAPHGMSGPTREFMKKIIPPMIQKIGQKK